MTPSSSKVFTSPDAWHGGTYDLALMLGPPSDGRLSAALDAVWSFTDIDGCFERADLEPGEQRRGPAVEPGRDLQTVLRGTARLPAAVEVACSTIPVREEDGNDWLYFGLPMGSLSRAYPVGAFPWDDGSSLAWREELDGWLRALAGHVASRQQFKLGMVGFTDGDLEPERALLDGVPERRWVGYLVPNGDVLCWYPPTEGAPIR